MSKDGKVARASGLCQLWPRTLWHELAPPTPWQRAVDSGRGEASGYKKLYVLFPFKAA